MGNTQQTYQQALQQLTGIDWQGIAQEIGVHAFNDRIKLPLFGENHHIGGDGCFNSEDEPATEAIGLVFCHFILNFPEDSPSLGEPVTFRELTGSESVVGLLLDRQQLGILR